jgi:hypothetical protein
LQSSSSASDFVVVELIIQVLKTDANVQEFLVYKRWGWGEESLGCEKLDFGKLKGLMCSVMVDHILVC